MQVETYGRSTGFTYEARRIDLPKAGPLDVSVGTFTRDGEVGVFDLESILPGPSLGGILSLETFANHTITLDLAANRLWIETPERASACGRRVLTSFRRASSDRPAAPPSTSSSPSRANTARSGSSSTPATSPRS